MSINDFTTSDNHACYLFYYLHQKKTPPMRKLLFFILVILISGFFASCGNTKSSSEKQADGIPEIPEISAAMQALIDSGEMSGAVTVVVTKDKFIHLDASGLADIAGNKPMQPDALFWIASMTKPITGVAVMILHDEGKLSITDPVSKYIPSFAGLLTPSGNPAVITIAQILSHTSGLGEAGNADLLKAKTLADLIPAYLNSPMQFEPGAKWKYTQSGINLAARIVEIVSGMPFDEFLRKRLFDPLGMKSTTFYPVKGSSSTLVTGYSKNKQTGLPDAIPLPEVYSSENHPPLGNGGLFSTGPDYARFCQMLLGEGSYNGTQYLSREAFKLLISLKTGDMPTGFLQSPELGSHGLNYGYGIGICVLRSPHEGVAEMLSPGTFGHGGAWGTQAWIDPVKGIACILMVQRPGSGNSDGSEVRRIFQQTAFKSLGK